MPFGSVVSFLFFTLVFFAALSSSLGMLEVAISRYKEIHPGNRAKIATLFGFICWLFGISAVLSFNLWQDIRPLSWIELYSGKNIFASYDFVLGNFVLPLNGFLIAIFCGWVLPRKTATGFLGFKTEFFSKA